MNRRAEDGNILVVIILVVLLAGSLGFGGWAFMGRQDYKNNVDQKIDKAVEIAVDSAKTQKDNEFVEKEKEPLREYKGPVAFGGVSVKYPKTWSALVDERGTGTLPLDATLHPNFVPIAAANIAYALRLQIKDSLYTNELKLFDSDVKSGKVRVSPYRAANVQSVLGSRIDGEIIRGRQGSMILLPLRDKTIKIWTEAEQFVGDLNTHILPHLNFNP